MKLYYTFHNICIIFDIFAKQKRRKPETDFKCRNDSQIVCMSNELKFSKRRAMNPRRGMSLKNLRNRKFIGGKEERRLEAAISHGRVNRRKDIIGIRVIISQGACYTHKYA